MSAYIIPLNRVAAWFIMRICPIKCYNDVLRLLLRQFTLFDKAMMYEAVTSKPYGHPARMWMLALHEQPTIAPHLRDRFHNLLYASPIRLCDSAIAVVIYSFARFHHMRVWVEDCIKHAIISPFMFVLNNRTNIRNHYANDVHYATVKGFACWAIESKSLTCLQACYATDATIFDLDHDDMTIDSFACMEGTWLWLLDRGVRLDNRYNTRIIRCIAESPENGERLLSHLTDPMTVSEIVGEAVCKGEMLDWIHARLSIDEMLSADWQSSTLHVNSAKWFISKDVPIARLHSHCYKSARYVWPIATPSDRARMLATDTSVIYWYKCKLKRGKRNRDLKYDRDLFMHFADMKTAQEVRRIESAYMDL
jgi:hypothetical protein